MLFSFFFNVTSESDWYLIDSISTGRLDFFLVPCIKYCLNFAFFQKSALPLWKSVVFPSWEFYLCYLKVESLLYLFNSLGSWFNPLGLSEMREIAELCYTVYGCSLGHPVFCGLDIFDQYFLQTSISCGHSTGQFPYKALHCYVYLAVLNCWCRSNVFCFNTWSLFYLSHLMLCHPF